MAAMFLFGVAGGAVAQQAPITLVADTARSGFPIRVGPVDLPLPAHDGHGSPAWGSGHGDGGHHAHGDVRSHSDPHGAHGAVFPPIEEVVMPDAVYLHGFSYRVVDGHGRELPTDVLHHRNPTRAILYGGGMGVVGGVFLPDETADWPTADLSDRLYRLDRRHYMREVRGRFEQVVRAVESEQGDERDP